MAYDAITTAELASGKPVFGPVGFGAKVKGNFDYLYGVVGSLAGSAGIPNGSFEVDSDADGIPNSWTRNLYSGGAGALYTTSPAQGAQAWSFTHPGGVGNGGGYLTSDYMECSPYQTFILGGILWSTAAGMKNKVQVQYYTKAKAANGAAVDLYNSTANATSPTAYVWSFTPTASSCYFKLILVGGFTDTDVAGTAYFDGFWTDYLVIEARIGAAAVSQSKLKTSSGEVSVTATAALPGDSVGEAWGANTLPGGEYGLSLLYKATEPTNGASLMVTQAIPVMSASTIAAYSQGNVSGGGGGLLTTSYVARMDLYVAITSGGAGGSSTISGFQRYISASGRDHWIYLLLDIVTRKIIQTYQAPDHPSANTQLLHEKLPHPFPGYDPRKHEIVLADNDVLDSIVPLLNRRTSIADVLNRCIVDDAKSAEYDARLIKKINEFPGDPYPGSIKVETMETPQEAKIMIVAPEITIETFAMERLPETIQYRKLWLSKWG
jgi:hypothetical protein